MLGTKAFLPYLLDFYWKWSAPDCLELAMTTLHGIVVWRAGQHRHHGSEQLGIVGTGALNFRPEIRNRKAGIYCHLGTYHHVGQASGSHRVEVEQRKRGP